MMTMMVVVVVVLSEKAVEPVHNKPPIGSNAQLASVVQSDLVFGF